MVGGFSRGIKMAKMALENAQEDFRMTVVRTEKEARLKQGITNRWLEKGKVCGTLLEELSVRQRRGKGLRQGFG
jgi:hypothetical protein